MFNNTIIQNMFIEVLSNPYSDTEEILSYFCPIAYMLTPLRVGLGALNWLTERARLHTAFSMKITRFDTVESGGYYLLNWQAVVHQHTALDGIVLPNPNLVSEGHARMKVADNKIVEYLAISELGKMYRENFIKNNDQVPYLISPLMPIDWKNLATLSDVALSFREVQALSLWLLGLSSKETAQVLDMSHRTVETYRENVKLKLKAPRKNLLFKKMRETRRLDEFLIFGQGLIKLKENNQANSSGIDLHGCIVS